MILEQDKHKNILLQILKDIYSDPNVKTILGFKGGTALYFFYDLPRFSLDLDFDLLDRDKEDEVLLRIKEIVSQYGKVKDSKKKRFSLFTLLSYGEKNKNIKIDINFRNFESQYELKTYFGISMLVMNKKDLFANKLVAMEERFGKANRDIYDVHFFLKNNWDINEEIIKTRTKKNLKEYIGEIIGSLEKLSNYNILDGLGEVLDEKQKDWVKKNLIKDTIFLLKIRKDTK